jgi:hypothetical protein
MDQLNSQSEGSSSPATNDERRRDALRKLGRFAAYAAPFTVLAVNSSANQAGAGSGGRKVSSVAKK